ncbi:hypothetical protein AAC387_Pa02g1949 [Persea americana]
MVSSSQLPVRLSQPLPEVSSLERRDLFARAILPVRSTLPDSDQFARANPSQNVVRSNEPFSSLERTVQNYWASSKHD